MNICYLPRVCLIFAFLKFFFMVLIHFLCQFIFILLKFSRYIFLLSAFYIINVLSFKVFFLDHPFAISYNFLVSCHQYWSSVCLDVEPIGIKKSIKEFLGGDRWNFEWSSGIFHYNVLGLSRVITSVACQWSGPIFQMENEVVTPLYSTWVEYRHFYRKWNFTQ